MLIAKISLFWGGDDWFRLGSYKKIRDVYKPSLTMTLKFSQTPLPKLPIVWFYIK